MHIRTASKIWLTFLAVSLMASGCDRLRNYTDQEHIQRAKEAQSKGKLKEAVIELKNAVNKNGSNSEARWLLGEAYLLLEQGAPAEKELKRARELGVGQESLALPIGRAYLLQGKNREVLEEIQTGSQATDRRNAEILKLRGDAQLGARRAKEACESYAQSNKQDPGYVDAYRGLALCAAALDKDVNRARALLDQALKLDPKHAPTWTSIAEWEQAQGNIANAESAYNEAIKLDPHNRAALFNRSLIQIAKANLSAAENDLAVLREYLPHSAETLFIEATISYLKKKYDKTRDALTKLEKVAPNYPPAWLLNAMLAYSTHSDAVAEQQVNRYLALRSRDMVALRLKAKIFLRTARPALALETLTPLLKTQQQDQELLVLAGSAHMQLKEYDKATQMLERAVQINPKNVLTQASLARGYLAAGQEDRGVAVLQAASQLEDKSGEADLLLAIHYLSGKQFDKALTALATLERRDAKNPVMFNLKGNAYYGKGDVGQARKSWEEALRVEPTYLPAASNLAQLDLLAKQMGDAKGRYENVLKANPKSISAMLALAELARRDNKGREYLQWLERAANTDSAAIAPRLHLVRYYIANKNPQQALAIAREAYGSNPGNPEALDLLGRTQYAAGEHENALASYKQLVDKNPDSVSARVDLAGVQSVLRRYDEARASLEKALKLSPNNLGVLQALSAVAIAQGRLDDSVNIARNVQQAYPKLAMGWMMEGDARRMQKRMPEALKAFEQAFAVQASTETLSRLHSVRAAMGDAGKADAQMLDWIQSHANDISARLYLAESYLRRGMKAQSREQYEQVLKASPNHALALNNLANIYLETKDPKALEYAERAYRMAPDNAGTLDTYGWTLLNANQVEKALDMLAKAKAAAPAIPTIQYHYAAALARNNRTAEAVRELRVALASKQSFAERNAAEQLLASLGK